MKTRIAFLARQIQIPVGIVAMLVAICGFRAEAAILQIKEDGLTENWAPGTAGWYFKALEDLTVTRLGVWDYGHDGLAQSRQVTLWGPSGAMVQAMVPAGVAGALDGGFRWVTLATPVSLSSGQLYSVGVYYLDGSDALMYSSTSVTPPAGMYTFLHGGWAYGDSTPGGEYPTSGYSYFGANLDVAPLPVPDSGGSALFGSLFLGAICLVRVRRIRRGVAQA